jgi:hypothetical protein
MSMAHMAWGRGNRECGKEKKFKAQSLKLKAQG